MQTYKIKNQKNLFYFLGVFVVNIALYAYTLAPSMYWLDSVLYLIPVKEMGVSYSPGYPLYLLIAKLWSFLPLFGLDFTQKVNLLSGVFAALASGFVYLTGIKIIENNFVFFKNKITEKAEVSDFVRVVAALAGIIFGFSHSLWYQATYAEVYSMHTFLIAAVIYLIILLGAEGLPQKKLIALTARQKKLCLAIAIVYGLTYANHPMTVGFIPAMLWLAWQFREAFKSDKKFIKILGACFLFSGLVFYIYLPMRSLQNPVMDMGNPENLGNFITHVSGPANGLETRSYAFLNREFFENFFNWIKLTYYQFFFFGLLFIYAGVRFIWKKEKKLFSFFAVAVSGTVGFGAFYITGEYESWFLPAHYIFAIVLIIGAISIFQKWERAKIPVILALFFIIFSSLQFNWTTLNRRSDYFPPEIGHNILKNVEEKSIIIIESGAAFSSVFYNQHILGDKPGVIALWKNNFWLPWVRENIRGRAAGTDLYVPANDKNPNEFKTVKDKFKYNDEYLEDFIKGNIDKYNVYTVLPLEIQGLTIIPWGYGYKVIKGEKTDIKPDPALWNFDFNTSKFCQINFKNLKSRQIYGCKEFNMENGNGLNYYHPEDVQIQSNLNFDELRSGYSVSYMNLADLYVKNKEYKKAIFYYDRAINLLNDNFSYEQKFNMYLQKALALAYDKQSEKAIEYAYEIDKLYPQKSEIAWVLGAAFNELGKNKEAFGILTEAMKIFPKDENLNKVFNKVLTEYSKSVGGSVSGGNLPPGIPPPPIE